MLLASLTPRSTILPTVALATQIPFLRLFRIQLPAPVTVHCAVGVRTPPYSSGKRYCRSADAKCDEVTHAETFAPPLSTADAAIIRLCAIVEHAPYCPRYGIPNFISPKLDPMHWLSKSPAKTQSTSFACVFERSRAFSRASPWNILSACSKVSQPS